ncbi:MAG: flagellar basal body P-ring protein FlgI [Planctomycetales bacterium]|nr:flagellar basal body P-ring protein FlgI [Planctomycetales bacterium]
MSPQRKRREKIRESLESEERPKILSDIGIERLLTRARLENVGLVTRLVGTGGKVRPSQPRDRMLAEMARNSTHSPNALLDDPGTAMVVATVDVPPAARKGTLLDVTVDLSSHAEATSLERGWLVETPLMEMSQLGGQVLEGFKYASGEGQIVTVAQVTGSQDPKDQLKGMVIGGAVLLKQRELGIGIHQEFADAVTLAAVLPEINKRFTIFQGSKHVGVATPTDDNNIRVLVPHRYDRDPFHFISVVLNTAFNELPQERSARVEQLTRQLQEPTTVRRACWQLEALGEEAVPALLSAVNSTNPEIRFYAAHSLAYLDDRRAIAPLFELCKQEPAFQAMCLNGLSVISHYEAEDALRELLHAADPKCKYGAVRALRWRDERDPQVSSTVIGETGKILEVPSEGPPLVAVSLSQIPEIVIFGSNPSLVLPEIEYVNPRMLVRTEGPGVVSINHFEPGQEDRIVQAAPDLRAMLVGIAEAGGTYGDWVSFIRLCREKAYLAEPVAVNPIPEAGQVYHREQGQRLEPGEKLLDDTFIDSLPLLPDDEAQKEAKWYNPFSW